jgi:hypothetical protein
MPWIRGVLLATACLTMQSTGHAAAIFSVAAATSAGIQSTVDAFRTDLGSLNANVAGSFGSGRREINWDGVPDAFSAPNNLPANFFNVNSPRGVVFATSGTGFQVSANAASGTAIEFGNINATYPDLFTTFSSPRLFTALGSTITDVPFFIPGTTTGALTRGFGAVFTDVDLANTTSLEFFDANNNSLGTFFVPSLTGNQTLEFLGVDFGSAIVSRVRITSGNSALGPNEDATHDLVVMDDFIYGEPVPVPEPTSLALLTTGLAAVALARRRRKIT